MIQIILDRNGTASFDGSPFSGKCQRDAAGHIGTLAGANTKGHDAQRQRVPSTVSFSSVVGGQAGLKMSESDTQPTSKLFHGGYMVSSSTFKGHRGLMVKRDRGRWAGSFHPAEVILSGTQRAKWPEGPRRADPALFETIEQK